MKRSAKVCWIGFVFSTIVIAAVAGLVIYFTAFRKSISDKPNSTFGTTSAESTSSNGATGSSSTISLSDHFSHSVPGFEYRVVDFDGDGVQEVQLDGSRSHTHYYDAGPPVIIGKLVEMTWFDKESKKTLSTVAKPILNFPIGTTIVGLTVADDFRDSHTDYTTVIVEKPISDGAYCYFYPPSQSSTLDLPDDLTQGERPIYAMPTEQIDFQDDSTFPSILSASAFQMRCIFSITTSDDDTSINFRLDHYGPAKMIIDNDGEYNTIFESDEKRETTSEGSTTLIKGDNIVQILYSRTSTAAGKLVLQDGGESISYDMSRVLPIITAIDPTTSTLEGGGSAKITGIGLRNNLRINFGTKELVPDEKKSTDTEAIITVPESSATTVLDISATNAAGTSNQIQFQYSSSGKAPIKFKEEKVMADGKALDIPLITGIRYGPDHRFYCSAVNHRVHSFAVNSKMQASEICSSPILGKDKSILGLAFNPIDTSEEDFKLYVSASILDWKRDNKLDSALAWANGEILIIKKDINGNCLDVAGEPIISGLPVSNHDHGVNGLVFDNEGMLHIQVGGFTNAGVNDESSLLGGIDENPFSGACISARILKPGFNGKIQYSTTKPEKASVIGGDVEVFSSGWRNSFGICKHSNGFLYATDNGASVGFGEMSTGCGEQKELGGKNLDDKLGKVIKGKYAGHPNRNRGKKDSRQCTFRGPEEESDDFFQAPIATFESSTDGVMEYTANTFGGQMKGDLLCTKYSTQESPGKVFRVRLDENGDADGNPDELWPSSGLSVEMSPWGHLLMPRVYKREIMVLTPVTHAAGQPSFTAVMPFRGPLKGGNRVLVTGENLPSGTVASFDGQDCTDVEEVEDGISFFCTVPPGSSGNDVSVSLILPDGTTIGSSGIDYQYMKI